MGTSDTSKGPGSNSSLVPTWPNGSDADPLPGGNDAAQGDGNDAAQGDGGGTGGQGGQGEQEDTASRPVIEPAPLPARFQSARRNFSYFAKSGGNDLGALRRAVRDYVRSGTCGSKKAMLRMGTSRVAANRTLGVLRGFRRGGVDAMLRGLNLKNLAGHPAAEIFLGITDVICREGGSIDEGIARDAWLETIAEMDQLGIEELDSASSEQSQEVFLSFIAHAIKTRLFQDIGAKGLQMAEDLDAFEAFEARFLDYIRRSVRDTVAPDLSRLAELSDTKIRNTVDETYRNAWNLLEVLGDTEA